jgi:hypothetical protein
LGTQISKSKEYPSAVLRYFHPNYKRIAHKLLGEIHGKLCVLNLIINTLKGIVVFNDIIFFLNLGKDRLKLFKASFV